MFEFLKERNRRRFYKTVKTSAVPVFLNIREVASASFVCRVRNAEDIAELQDVTALFKKMNLPYQGVAVVPNKVECNLPDNFTAVTAESLNWWGAIANKEVESAVSGERDLLVVYNPQGNFTLDYITVKSGAKFKVGVCNNPKVPYNLVVEPVGGETSPAEFLKEVIRYLSIINKESEEE